MEKIKSVLSGGEKSADATQDGRQDASLGAESNRRAPGGLTGEGSHLAGSHPSGAPSATDTARNHPIYDQFTGKSSAASGEPTRPTAQPPHFSNTADLKQTPPSTGGTLGSSEHKGAASLRPDRAHHRPANFSDDNSTASIRSGVIGFPQGSEDSHAALNTDDSVEQRLGGNQVVGGSDRDHSATGEQPQSSRLGRDAALGAGTVGGGSRHEHEDPTRMTERQHQPYQSGQAPGATDEQKTSSHLGRDAALGAGALGAGGLAAHEYGNRREHEHPTGTTEHQPFERSLQDSNLHESDRSFPLAGGVTTQRPADHTTSLPKTSTNEREPGTKEKVAGVHDGHGREGLAGAAAAAAATSAIPGEHERKHETIPRDTRTQDRHNPEALAAAQSAAATSSIPHSEQEHAHGGHGHTFTGDPCASDEQRSTGQQPGSGLLYTSGPHSTDLANRIDPRLHIPGEFPDPTPVEEPSEPSYGRDVGAGATTGTPSQHELRHTGSLDQPQTRAGEETTKPTSDHHYGRDAALAGGAGAAGLGAYAAGKHHQKEPAEVGSEIFPQEASPYSSQKLDPRVNARSGGLDEQKFSTSQPTQPSPHSSTQPHHNRDAALAGGTAAGTGLASHEATKHRDAPQETTQPSMTRHEAAHPTSQTQSVSQTQPGSHAQPSSQEEKSQHHYGRDAGLAGAGAATAGGLYYASQRDDKPDSGPATSTVGPHKSNIANVLDPRVQPDPALQKHHQAGPTSEDPASKTVGPHKSNVANVVDPRVLPQPEKQKGHTTTGPHESDTFNRLDPKGDSTTQPRDQHHYGRDTAVAGGAGAAGYGAHVAAKSYDDHRNTQPIASMNEQRYDPSVPGAHDPSKVTAHRTEEPGQSQHHYGRDAAVAGGLGAGAAYAGSKHHEGAQQPPSSQAHSYGAPQGTHPTTQGDQYPIQSKEYSSTQAPQDNKQQAQHHYGRDAAVAGGLGTAGAAAYAGSRHNEGAQQPLSSQAQPYEQSKQAPPSSFAQGLQDPKHQEEKQHHYGRDAAVAGGLGAAGAGAYAANRGDKSSQQPHLSQQSEDPANASHQRFDSVQDPKNQHQKRDAAAVAGATGVAGAGGAYAYSQHEEKERLAQEKAQEKAQQKELEHQRKEQQKEHDKALKAQQKDFEKEQAKEQKHHNKLVAAEDKKHEKEIAKEQKQHEKEAEKAAKEEEKEEGKEKKKHHLFGFLHRDKKDKDEESAEGSPRQSRDSPRHSKEYAGAGTAAGVVGGAAAYEATHDNESDTGSDGKKRNKLHKDPPPGHPAREALEHQQHGNETGKRQHMGIDGPIGDPNQVSSAHGAHPIEGQTGQHATDWEGIRKANTPY